MEHFFEALISGATWVGLLIGLLYAYRSVYIVVGFFRTRIYPKAERYHRYAIVIAARNEERVLGNLLDSISAQDYPKHLIDVFVVADHCTDLTAEVARAHGAHCYERSGSDKRTKGFALEYLFDCIEHDFGRSSFEGYFVLDADNLLKRDFVSRMNDAFDAGERIVTSYRNAKNFDSNWIAYSYGAHWLATTRTEHRARSFLGLSTRLQGTGYLFDSSLVKDGWHFTTLTEDRQFTAEAVCQGYRIGYQHAAVFYDEQPCDLPIALRQRMRWARGNLIVFFKVGGQLIRQLFRRLFAPRKSEHRLRDSFICYDVFMMTFPETLLFVLRKILLLSGEVALLLLSGVTSSTWQAFVWSLGLDLLLDYISRLLIPVYVTVTERHRMPKMPWYKKLVGCLLWPIFPLIGDISMLLACVHRVEWKPIPHRADVSIEQLEQK